VLVRPRRHVRGEIPDPWYGGDDDFMLAFDLAEKACVALLEHLQCRQPS
jgi:protein-tyrosine-phosphatase